MRHTSSDESGHQNREQFEALPEHYHAFKDVFEEKEFDRLPPSRPWDHAIELTKDFVPVKGKIYPLSSGQQEELDAFIKELLAIMSCLEEWRPYLLSSKEP